MNKKLFTCICIISVLLAACNNNNNKKNSGTDSSNIVVKAKPGDPIKLDSTKRYVYLTWDDSPQPPGTVNCKNVFREQAVKATFFGVGFNQVGPWKKRIIDSIRNEYPQFLLANHSFSHGFNDKYSKFYSASMTDNAFQDFIRNEKELKVPVKIIRLPGNNTWASKGVINGQKADNPLVVKLDKAGYKIVGWDIEWGQMGKQKAPKESATEMIKKINQKFEEGSTNQPNCIVILSHDRLFEKKQFADSLSKFISILKQDKRYQFETIDHYPSVQNN